MVNMCGSRGVFEGSCQAVAITCELGSVPKQFSSCTTQKSVGRSGVLYELYSACR